MRPEHVVGDLQLHADLVVDGWCWAPGRPRARLCFDILADDRIVAGGEASVPRPDLSIHGMTDTPHGFRLTLSPDALDRSAAVLLWARERASQVVFGQRLIEPSGPPPPDPAVRALRETLGAISGRLTARPRSPLTLAARLRTAAGQLGAALPAHAARHGPAVEASRRLLAAGAPASRLGRPSAPRVTLVLLATGAAPVTLATLRTMALAIEALRAETLLVDPGTDARTALLPSLLPGLVLLCADTLDTALANAAAHGRGEWLFLADTPVPSALPALLHRLEADQVALATGPGPGTVGLPGLTLGARCGIRLAVRRALLTSGDTIASLLARLRQQRAACVVLDEPWAPPPRRR